MSRANQLYEGFHKYGPKSRTRAPSSFRIPRSVRPMGKALYVLYSSPKFNPLTYEDEGNNKYIHEHDSSGVQVYLCDGRTTKSVPSAVARAQELVCLGKCLGLAYEDSSGDENKATFDSRKVEWYAAPNPTRTCPKGHALLVIEQKKRVLAMVWGGKLRVEPRGIVG
jgi:hypothetical protein